MSYLDTRMKDIYLGVDQSTPNIQHFGILGMKWGIRRYQNEDGTLTEEGKKRYKGMTIDDVENKHKANIEKNNKRFINNVVNLAVGNLMRNTRSNSKISKIVKDFGLGLEIASYLDIPFTSISSMKEGFDYRRDKKILENLQNRRDKKLLEKLQKQSKKKIQLI